MAATAAELILPEDSKWGVGGVLVVEVWVVERCLGVVDSPRGWLVATIAPLDGSGGRCSVDPGCRCLRTALVWAELFDLFGRWLRA